MKQNKHGFVLICILWVVALLTVITIGFGYRASLDRRAAAYSLDHAQAMAAARGAVERGILEIKNIGLMQRFLPPDQRGGTHLGESWAKVKNIYKEGYLKETLGIDKDIAEYTITDEDRYISINCAPKEVLENIKALDRGTIRRIQARRVGEGGNSEEVAVFQAVEELRYLRGMKDEEWFGDARKAGLKDLLTVYGDAQVNVNTAPREVLQCVPGIREDDLESILRYRAGIDGALGTDDDRGFSTMDDLSAKTGVQGATRQALNTYCKCVSGSFKITGLATRRAGRVRAVCSAIVSFSEDGMYVAEWQEKALGS